MLLESLLQDVRIGLRVLIKEKSFCALAVTVLALGICAVTTQFSVVNGVLLRGFSFHDPEQLVAPQLIDPKQANGNGNNFNGRTTALDYEDIAAQSQSYSAVSAYLNGSTINLTIGNNPQRLTGGYITEKFFSIIGVAPILGRDFTAADNRPGAEKTVIIGHQIWQRDFNGNPGVIGSSVRVNGRAATVIGVMPPGFKFPVSEEVWVPLFNEFPAKPRSDQSANNVAMLARLKPGVSIDQAQLELTTIARRLPLIEGRLLEAADSVREQKVCVVDAEFARRYWPGKSALGHHIFNNVTLTDQNAITIVGVVGSVKQSDLADTKPLGAVYLPYPSNQISIVVRTALAPEVLASTLRQAVRAIDPSLPVDDIKPLQTRIDDSLVSRRSPAVLAGAFAVVALLLAAVGTYGVLAYAVSQRRREIGVRMALGALPQQVLVQFMKLGATLLALGIVLGVAGAWAAGRAMQSVLFGVGAVDARVLAGTAGAMIAVVLLATFLPSLRATKVDPMIALRAE